MRWYWVDRFIEFESGSHAKAVKTISLAEDYLKDHFPGYPMMPKSLIVEGLALVGGLLLFEQSGYTRNPILARIPKARFFGEAFPGDTLIYEAKIEYAKEEGAMVSAACHKDDRLLAEVEIASAMFGNHANGHVDGPANKNGPLFDREVFLKMMRLLGVVEVGRAADGTPLVEPDRKRDQV